MADNKLKAAVADADQAERTPAEPEVRESEAERAVREAVEQGTTAYQDQTDGTWHVATEGDRTHVLFGDGGEWVVVANADALSPERVMYFGVAVSREAAALEAEGPRRIAEDRLRPAPPAEESEAERVQRKALGG